MKRYVLTVEYDGTNYCGWQSQDNGKTVQQTLEKAMEKVFQEKIIVFASGRTDAGVHAYGQVVHFDVETKIEVRKFAFAINNYLPDDIRVKKAEVVSSDFHARYNSKKKTYVYKIYNSDILSPVRRNFYHQVYGNIDVNLMKEASQKFLGEHDFFAFSSKSDKTNTVRTIYDINVKNNDDEIFIEICGNGFLYNMVRIIAGTLVEVGKGKIKIEDIDKIFESKNRRMSGKKLPANGLYLKSVDYNV